MPTPTDDLFPASPRVVYEKAPLIQVSCQLRFPRLLKIESGPPADFQERIRRMFPLLETTPGPLMSAPIGPAQLGQLPPEVLQLLNSQIGGSQYQFLTEDRATTVALTAESLSLTTAAYKEWGVFRDQLGVPLKALNDVYGPTFFARVGLRYIDVINREELGLQRPWSSLLRSELLGELALPQFEANLEQVARQARIRLPDDSGHVTVRHGFAAVAGKPGISYLIDFDFFRDKKTEIGDAENTLDHFNLLAGRAFRWCIRDELQRALGPKPVGQRASSVAVSSH